MAPSTSDATNHSNPAEGPGFLYSWNNSDEPVQITFIPKGPCQAVPDPNGHHLLLRTTKDGLSFQADGQPTCIIKLGNLGQRRNLEAIIADATGCKMGSEDDDTLSLIIAGQRLFALGRSAHLNADKTKAASDLPSKQSKQHFVNDLHDWLSGQLENSVKLGDAANYFKKSPRQVIRILKETTGSGFAEHLTMHRLTLARTLLMRTNGSIMEIAKKSGFNSREQFIRSFSKAFGWTPLQFRKEWNKASLSNSDLGELCRISEREPVSWLHPDHILPSPSQQPEPPLTLVVANALHEIVELFMIDSDGRQLRAGVLDRGAMNFINRDTAGSQWLVRTPGTKFERTFITPDQHAFAVISPDLTVQ